jgi:hypothetical protein
MQNSSVSLQTASPEDGGLQETHHPTENQRPYLHLEQEKVHADAEVTGMY